MYASLLSSTIDGLLVYTWFPTTHCWVCCVCCAVCCHAVLMVCGFVMAWQQFYDEDKAIEEEMKDQV